MADNALSQNSAGQIALDLVLNKAPFEKAMSGMSKMAASAGKTLGNALMSGANLSVRAGKAFGGAMLNAAGSMARSERSITASGKKIAAAIGGAFAVTRLVQFSKACIDLGSDLDEVQNVVDVTFGGMSKEIDRWSTDAITQFGLSETKAKQYTSTIGAMLKSMGFATGAAADMSKEIAGLAGDMASFYNLDADEAFAKIRSGISGETEPLKQLGVNLSEVNLQEYALAQGMTKSYSKMTQREKALLRYNYLLSVTSDAQGDFARTSTGWANQVRVLSLQFDSLKASLGQGLINVLSPVVKWLNAIVGRLVTAANAFKSFTSLLTGKQAQESSKATNNTAKGLTNASNAAGALASNTEAAGNAAKKAAKEMRQLYGFDQINKASSSSESDDTDGGSGDEPSSIIEAEDFDFGELEDVGEKLDSELKKLIDDRDWEGLGTKIAAKINKGLKKIYDVVKWETVGPKFTPFADGIIGVFNGLMDPETGINFEQLGQDFGAGINTMVYAANYILEGVEWYNIGTDLANMANGLQEEIDATSIGNLIGNKFNAAWSLALGFVDNFGWSDLGTKIADGINGYLDKANFSLKAEALAKFINGGFTTLDTLALSIDWTTLGEKLGESINSFLNTATFSLAMKSLSDFIAGGFETLEGLTLSVEWSKLGSEIGSGINNFFLDENNKPKIKVSAVSDFLNKGFSALKSLNLTIKWDDIASAVATSFNDAISKFDWKENGTITGDFIANAIGSLADTIDQVDFEAAFKGLGDYMDSAWSKIKPSMVKLAKALWGALVEAVKGLSETDTGKLVLAIAGLTLTFKAAHFAKWASGLIEGLSGAIKIGNGKKIGEAIASEAESGMGSASATSGTGIAARLGGKIKSSLAALGTAASPFLAPAATIGAGIGTAIAGAIILDGADWNEATKELGESFEKFLPGWKNVQIEHGTFDVDIPLKPYVNDPDLMWDEFTGEVFDQMGNYVKTDSENSLKVKVKAQADALDPTKKYNEMFGAGGTFYEKTAKVNQAKAQADAKDPTKKYNEMFGAGGTFYNLTAKEQEAVIKAKAKKDESFDKYFHRNEKGKIVPSITDGESTAKLGAEKKTSIDSYYTRDKKGKLAPKITDGESTAKLGAEKKTSIDSYYTRDKKGKLAPKITDGAATAKLGASAKDSLGKYYTRNQKGKLAPKTTDGESTAKLGAEKKSNVDAYFKKQDGLLKPLLGDKTATAYITADKATGYDSTISQFSNLEDKDITARIKAELTMVHNKTITVGRRKLEEIFGFASGGVLEKGKITQFAAGGYSGRIDHGTMLVAGEQGPEVMGKINGKTEILNRSQLASTMFASVSAAMAPLTNILRNATPRLAITGDARQQLGYTESTIRQIAQEAVGGGNTEVIELLKEILKWLLAMDPTMEVDGREIGRVALNYINNQTRVTGHTPIVLA